VVLMALQAYEEYIVLRVVSLVSSIVSPIVNIIALRMGGRAIAITAISLGWSILCYIFYFFYARKAIKLEFSFKGFRKDVLKEIFVFSGFLFLNSITDQITFSTDNIILSAVSGTSTVAVYTVGSQFKNYFQQFSTSVSSVFAPSVNLMVAQKQQMKELDDIFIRVGRIQFYVVSLILIGYLSIGQAFVRLWAGEDYTDAFYIGLLLMLSVFVPSFQNVGLEIQKAKNMHKMRSVVYFLIALANIALTIPFAKCWGSIGAAAATLITTFFGYVVFMNYYYQKQIGLDILGFWKSILQILPGYLPPIAAGILIYHYWKMDSYWDILPSAVMISLVFVVSVWCFSMNPYERALLGKPVRKLFKLK
jgi:O-antigen/teichoic acid export membrane protein